MSENGIHPPIGGFVRRPRTIEIVADDLDPADGAEPLRVTLAINMTHAELDGLIDMARRYGQGLTYDEIRAVVAPRVLAWNAVAYNVEAEGYTPVPTPAEGGPDVFRVVDTDITNWVLTELIQSRFGGVDRPKESTPPADTESGNGESNSDSPPLSQTPGRKRRKGSEKPSTAT